jgi:alpha-galactosidase
MVIASVPTAAHPPILFPARSKDDGEITTMVLDVAGDRLPVIAWVGASGELGAPGARSDAEIASGVLAAAGESGCSLLPEHWNDIFTRPALRGHRLRSPHADGQPLTGRDWSTAFAATGVTVTDDTLSVDAADPAAGLELHTELATIAGGALRIRHTLTNTGSAPYVVEGLEVVVPLPDSHTEVLDFTGRHERERSPQRHEVTDGLYLREGRRGRTGLDTAMTMVTGATGFGFTGASVIAVHVAWSGNAVLRLERNAATGATLGGGELLQPGEITLTGGESYTTPWVHVVASAAGLDGIAAAFHGWLRSLPSHPGSQPVTLNVWEAVYFVHDLGQLTALADIAARIGVERFVLDDGWFAGRRTDTTGLGDWSVDAEVWPDGLSPLVDHVRGLGMEFGLWFEPEMVNPDSDLYRAHPDWVLATGGREPVQFRNQLVLDLSRQQVREYLFERIDAVLSDNDIGYVKWDHNRDVLEAGGGTRAGAPVIHEQTLGYYSLLDALRRKHPQVDWESCAGGGGRIDLGVLERVQRVWTSDMTDSLARQAIQRWTSQLVAPEYLGAHVSATTSHQTGRTLPLDFRAATAMFGSFGIEWDLAAADASELDSLAEWITRYQRFRDLLHTGRMVRIDSPDPAVLLHGVVAADRSEALIAHVQLDESSHNRGLRMRIPGLDPARRYRARWAGPVDRHRLSVASQVDSDGPGGGDAVPGAVLIGQGLWISRRRPETILLVHLTAVD